MTGDAVFVTQRDWWKPQAMFPATAAIRARLTPTPAVAPLAKAGAAFFVAAPSTSVHRPGIPAYRVDPEIPDEVLRRARKEPGFGFAGVVQW
jgi:hypothetical protein